MKSKLMKKMTMSYKEKRLCQNVGTTFFYNLSSCYLFFCLRRFFLIHLVTSCYIPVVSGYK